jgi:hypothetical protein
VELFSFMFAPMMTFHNILEGVNMCKERHRIMGST